MPRIKDIIDKVLAIVYADLKVESLIQERIERKVKVTKLYRLFNHTELDKPEHSELTKKRLMTLEKNKNAELNLESFTPVELTIIKTICKVHRVEIYNLLSTIRKREVINARFQMMALLRYQMFYTFDHIGYIFNKDHSSIIHGIDKHGIYYEVDVNYKNQYNTVLNEIEELYPGMLSAKAQITLSPRITFINKKINKVKYHKPKGETVGRKDRFKLTDAKAN